MNEKKPYRIDVAVFLIFFNRPDTFQEVFNSVKKARPKKLFLVCDGPRVNNEKDRELAVQCKSIAEEIDWNCEVYKNYSEENLGCGKRMSSGISWAFEYVDRIIILEDDCVPGQDFFLFCHEMLERYKDDEHVCMINAMNHLGVYDKCPYSYFFGQGCCWGWATWKRVWRDFDYNMTFLSDNYAMKCLERKYEYYSNAIKIGREKKEILDKGGKLTAWTYQMGMSTTLSHEGVAIVPKYNLITNIGFCGEHSAGLKRLNKKTRQYFNMKTYKMEFPLSHPKYEVEDLIYYDLVKKKFKLNLFDKIESLFRKLLFGRKRK